MTTPTWDDTVPAWDDTVPVIPGKKKQGIMSMAWNKMGVPEQMSREGLQMLAQMATPKQPVTGNMARDVVANAPRIGLETLSEVAPSFVSPASMIAPVALRGVAKTAKRLKPIVKGFGKQVESLTGSAPGSLEAAFKDSTLIRAPGKKAVQSLYDSAKSSVGGGFRQALKEIPDKKQLVDEAFKLAKTGELSPAEALEARKTLDSIKKGVAAPYFDEVRSSLDKIAKTAFEKGDKAYQRAIHAESLRNLMPQNKYGGTSAFKMALATGLQGIAEAGGIPKLAARAIGLMISPAAGGVAATAAGAASRAIAPLVNAPIKEAIVIPAVTKVLTEEIAKKFLRKAKGDREKARQMAKHDGYAWDGMPED